MHAPTVRRSRSCNRRCASPIDVRAEPSLAPMTAEILAWLETHEGPWAYAVLALACLVEYVFPPFPGDTIALFGVFLAVRAGYSKWAVFAALNVGAMVGGLVAYGFGCALLRTGRRPRFLRTVRAEEAIATLETHYRARGGVYLAVNRFVPALRAFFFVAAGIARVPVWQVIVFGGASAMAWNAVLFVLGWSIGASFETLATWVERYAVVVVLLLATLVIVFVLRRNRARRNETGSAGHEAKGEADR